MLKGGLVIIWELEMNLGLTLIFIHLLFNRLNLPFSSQKKFEQSHFCEIVQSLRIHSLCCSEKTVNLDFLAKSLLNMVMLHQVCRDVGK